MSILAFLNVYTLGMQREVLCHSLNLHVHVHVPNLESNLRGTCCTCTCVTMPLLWCSSLNYCGGVGVHHNNVYLWGADRFSTEEHMTCWLNKNAVYIPMQRVVKDVSGNILYGKGRHAYLYNFVDPVPIVRNARASNMTWATVAAVAMIRSHFTFRMMTAQDFI